MSLLRPKSLYPNFSSQPKGNVSIKTQALFVLRLVNQKRGRAQRHILHFQKWHLYHNCELGSYVFLLCDSGRLSASGCTKHRWLNKLEEKAKHQQVTLKSQIKLQRYMAAQRQWKVRTHTLAQYYEVSQSIGLNNISLFFLETFLRGNCSQPTAEVLSSCQYGVGSCHYVFKSIQKLLLLLSFKPALCTFSRWHHLVAWVEATEL